MNLKKTRIIVERNRKKSNIKSPVLCCNLVKFEIYGNEDLYDINRGKLNIIFEINFEKCQIKSLIVIVICYKDIDL
ncbi:LOW QUALITY PROTEIN: hypothetical protein T552_04208 [Pneumocystis carinii B80]|uniref:Uncharacterized protein n=1 Tax=Pneumocystis carinii (strain B80) TaxID=1408658 RepID=A0A0W4ZCH2_PNEC8|nr:LOW QUALITY PROTEIN: hypothetical protein T552_04208 [Pneumocystis carinii B80]KTW26005.1 LOW QUALITY PROTEIN: hypothetical protein T552_04208 [Pneumocystis carinii B80]